MYILGISAFFHDSAVCLLKDGEIVAAAQEERFSRKKQDPAFPRRSLLACFEHAGITIDDVDYVGFYEKPLLKFERILKTYARFLPRGYDTFRAARRVWFNEKLWLPGIIKDALIALSPSEGEAMRWDGRLMFADHHRSHAASAFLPSPFSEAAILVLDGVGEWATTSLAHGTVDDSGIPRIRALKELRYPDSIGLLYSAFTYYLGFRVNSGEYKLMGLAPYGEPRYADRILDHLIDLREDGSFEIDMKYFSYPYAKIMINDRFRKLFGMRERESETSFTQEHFDIAASIQKVTEQVVVRIARYLRDLTGERRLCMAGGVALNCVANGVLLREGIFDDVWVQPAAGDAGGAVGVAFHAWHEVLGRKKRSDLLPGQDLMAGTYLGPAIDRDRIRQVLLEQELPFRELPEDELLAETCRLLVSEMAVGWYQGRMEFGPRALGARSILGDPRSPRMQRVLNLKIKFRESFRPFAPSVLREHVAEWFELTGHADSRLGSDEGGYDSPYMLLVAPVQPSRRRDLSDAESRLCGIDKLRTVRSEVPACTHVDHSARIHTVEERSNPRYYRLIRRFFEETGVPMLVKTSFNIRGEPIVCSPDDAINCFLGTEMDALVMDDFLLLKSDLSEERRCDYRDQFALD